MWFRTSKPNYQTYYATEDDLHPRLVAAFEWYHKFLDECIGATYSDQVTLAGGALRSFFTDTPVRDYDLYCSPNAIASATDIFPDLLRSYSAPWTKTSDTNFSFTYKRMAYDPANAKFMDNALNIMKQPYTSMEDVIDRFDFTVCMCAISEGAIVFHPDYFTDLATRQIRINNPEDPMASMWRIQKYIKLGYSIDRKELYKLCEELHELEKFPTLVKDEKEKNLRSLKETPKTLEEIFRSS